MQLSAKLRNFGTANLAQGITHWCPGCNETHAIYTKQSDPQRPVWIWDGNVHQPTVGPSVKITGGRHSSHHVCHYFLKSGNIEFCADSTHSLAGTTVPLPDLPPSHTDKED